MNEIKFITTGIIFTKFNNWTPPWFLSKDYVYNFKHVRNKLSCKVNNVAGLSWIALPFKKKKKQKGGKKERKNMWCLGVTLKPQDDVSNSQLQDLPSLLYPPIQHEPLYVPLRK